MRKRTQSLLTLQTQLKNLRVTKADWRNKKINNTLALDETMNALEDTLLILIELINEQVGESDND